MERQDFDVDLFRAGAGLRGSVHVSDRATDGSLNADGTVKVPQGRTPGTCQWSIAVKLLKST